MRKKFVKKVVSVGLSFIVMLILIVGMISSKEVKAASFEDINKSTMFFKQNTTSTCTLASAAMLVRRAALLNGNNSWASVTENSLQSTAWLSGAGLLNSFSYAGINVSSAKISSNRTQTMISLLASHPEGIVIYDFSKPHAILLTDYTNGTFYCADPSSGAPAGRIPISQATITVESIDKYWYVSSPSLSLTAPIGNDPIGCLDLVEGKTNSIRIRGWAFDPDSQSQSIEIHVYIGGSAESGEGHKIVADTNRSDVNSIYGSGENHGFDAEIPTSLFGIQSVYVYAINIGLGSNQLIGMQTINIMNANDPSGNVDNIQGGTGFINIRGWAFDLDDVSANIEIHVYIVDAEGIGEGYKIIADTYRNDVNNIYGVGDYHGFDSQIFTSMYGSKTVNVYAINVGGGGNVLLTSETVEIACKHLYGEYIPNNDVTHSRICNNCGETDVTNCSYRTLVTKPTCSEIGYTTYTCVDCSYAYNGDYVDCVEHSFTNYISDNNATSKADGTKTAYCDYGCGVTKTIVEEGSAAKKEISNSNALSVPKVKAFKAKAGKKKLTLSWKKLSGITGYQIQVSIKKNFRKAKMITVSNSKKKCVKKGLKSKKKYYIRIRAYKNDKDINGKFQRAYGTWSKLSKKTK